MCGLAGVFSNNALALSQDEILRMTTAISHRGPDDRGMWIDAEAGVAFGHRRLSIIDLTKAGKQPMQSSSRRYIIIFNGEIYNNKELRSNLPNHNWNGGSDTETLLAAIEKWGLMATLERCIGMFAFALWDSWNRELILCRDRLGEKPLYWSWQKAGKKLCFLFGSELKALKAHSFFSADINREALSLFMKFGYVPTPHTIYTNVQKLTPGSVLRVSLDTQTHRQETYWSFNDVTFKGVNNPITEPAHIIVDQLDTLLKSAVSQQMIADVPVGAFLSGGVDSSLIASLMQSQSSQPIKTFTVGFDEREYSEAKYAKAVAQHLGTNHTEIFVSPREALDVISSLPQIYCEPFADSSQIPTYLVSKLARQDVTVSLSGDGGDELFAGYNRHILANKVGRILSVIPPGLRSILGTLILSVPPNVWNSIATPLQTILKSTTRLSNFGEKIHKGASGLSADGIEGYYLNLVTHWKDEDVVLNEPAPPNVITDIIANLGHLDYTQKIMALDTMTYLPDDILVKVDRAAMAVSLESRVPLLDHRVVEYAWSLPQSMKLNNGVGKWALREVLYRYVPKSLIERPKMGFALPIDQWLRGPLKDWAEDLLDETRLKNDGYFDSNLIREKWCEHLSKKKNSHHLLWNALMFQAWLESEK